MNVTRYVPSWGLPDNIGCSSGYLGCFLKGTQPGGVRALVLYVVGRHSLPGVALSIRSQGVVRDAHHVILTSSRSGTRRT